jgi:hypothetical protein
MPPAWVRMFDLIGGIVSARRGVRDLATRLEGGLAPLDARLLGFAVAAIKKAFERDSDRMALEREHFEAERARAEAALRLEWTRQEAGRRIAEARVVAGLTIAIWAASAVLAVALASGYTSTARWIMASGWVALVAAIGLALTAARQVGAWVSVAVMTNTDPPNGAMTSAATWLLVIGFALSAASVLLAL